MARKNKQKLPETAEETNEFLNEMDGESDRAAAILAGAYLDMILEKLLRNHMIDNPRVDDLFGPDRPFGSFSARIRASFALGFISEREYEDLNTIRGIRNDFAHHLHGLSFETPSIRDRCRNLHLANEFKEYGISILRFDAARDYYTLSFSQLMSRLDIRAVQAGMERPKIMKEFRVHGKSVTSQEAVKPTESEAEEPGEQT